MILNKKIIVISAVLVFSIIVMPFGTGNNIYANEIVASGLIQPYFSNIILFQNQFDISSSGQATAAVYLTARNVNSLRLDVALQRYNNGTWQTIKDWTITSSGTSVGLSESYYVSKGYTYRTVASGYVYQNGILLENISSTSDSRNY